MSEECSHGIDAILREAWESGVALCGLSAGSLCWFAESVTGFLSRIVSSRPDASGWRLEKRDDVVAEARLPVTYLGASQPATPTLVGVPPAQAA